MLLSEKWFRGKLSMYKILMKTYSHKNALKDHTYLKILISSCQLFTDFPFH